MEDIRAEIDSIDSQIVALIGERAGYVEAATQFKTDQNAVKAPDRVKRILEKRRQWATEANIDPDIIERIFSTLVDYFINKEMKSWEREQEE